MTKPFSGDKNYVPKKVSNLIFLKPYCRYCNNNAIKHGFKKLKFHHFCLIKNLVRRKLTPTFFCLIGCSEELRERFNNHAEE